MQLDTGHIIFHLCGSRWKLAQVYNTLYPESPYDPRGLVYMFSAGGSEPPYHIWLVVKIINGKIIVHPWALGHEMIHILKIYLSDINDPD